MNVFCSFRLGRVSSEGNKTGKFVVLEAFLSTIDPTIPGIRKDFAAEKYGKSIVIQCYTLVIQKIITQ